MAEYDPLDNPSEVSGFSGEYYIKERQKAEAKKRQAIQEIEKRTEAARAKEKKQKDEEARRKALTVNPIKEFLTPVGQAVQAPFEWVSDRAEEAETAILGVEEVKKRKKRADEVRKGLRSPFDKRDEIPEAERQSYKKGQEQLSKDLAGPVDILKVPFKAAVSGVEGVLDIATQATLDLTYNRGKTDDEYIRAAWDFGVTPETQLGKTAAQLISFAAVTRQASKALGKFGKIGTAPMPKDLKGAQWFAAKGKRLLTDGLIPGAIADFILTDPEDGNVSSLVQKLVPEEYQNNVLFALAASPNDKPLLNRLKSTAEGAPLNALGNVLISLIPARQIAQFILKRGGSKEEALGRAVESFTEQTDQLAKQNAKDAELERIRWSEATEAEMNQLLSKEIDLKERLNQIDSNLDPDEAVRIDAELEDIQIRKTELENIFYESADPNVNKAYWESEASIKTIDDVNEAIADAMRAEDLDGGTNTVRKYGGGGNILTDAQIRLRNLENSQISVINNFKNKIDFDDVSLRINRPKSEIIEYQAKVVDKLDDAIRSYDEVLSENDILALFEEADGVLPTKRGKIIDNEAAGAAALFIDELSKDIYNIAYKGEKLDYSGIGGANNFDRLIDRFVAMMKLYKESSTYYGSSLNSFKFRLQAIANLKTPQKYLESLEQADTQTITGMLEWAEKIKTLARKGDPEAEDQMRRLVRAMVLAEADPGKTVKYFSAVAKVAQNAADNIFYNNVLSGVKSLATNFLAIQRAILDPSAILLRGLFKGDEAVFEAGLAGLSAFRGSLSEAWQTAKVTWRSETRSMGSAQDVLATAELKAKIEIMEKMAITDDEKLAVGAAKALVAYAKFVQPVGNFFSAQDTFVQTVVFRQRIAEMATLKAYREAPDAASRGDLFQKYLSEYSQYMDPQTGQIKDKGLALYAQMSTFQNDPGKTINAFSTFIKGVPYGKQLIPFIRTPANIMKYRLEFMPLTQRFSERYAKAVASGDELTVAEIEGRQLIGNLVLSTGMFLGMSGTITGNLPADPRERKRWLDLGIQPRSVNFFGQQISYARLEPLSDILAIAADLGAVLKYWGTEQPGAADLIERFSSAFVTGFAASFTEKNYFANFEPLADLINTQNLTPGKLEKLIAGYAFNQAVPYASAVRGFANSFDPYKREYENAWQRVFVNNTPILRNLAPPMMDELTGKPMRNPYGNPWNANLPFEINPQENDPVKQMLLKARYDRRDLKTYKNVDLTAEQREIFRKEVYKTGRIRQRLEKLMKQEWFWEDMKAYRGRPFNPDAEPSRRPRFYNEIARAYEIADSIALRQLELQNEAFKEAIKRERINRQKYKQRKYSEVSSSSVKSDLDNLIKFA